MQTKIIIATFLVLISLFISNEFVSSMPALVSKTISSSTVSPTYTLNLKALPLGDGKYTTSSPKKGYIYLCNARTNEGAGGAQKQGSWINGKTWDKTKKIAVQGDIKWPNANISIKISNKERIFTGNNLPTNHNTGTFPVSRTDPAYTIDKNPNKISEQKISLSLPAYPSFSSKPNCIGGEVGIMTNGVVLYNGFDAQLKDAVANEVQDKCDGHPQIAGQYHYHGPSSCFRDSDIKTVIGYAFDGFPITGAKVSATKSITTNDLDECHGMTSEIILDGKKQISYHYVLTQDFPYSVSCFKGKSAISGPTIQNTNTQPGQSRQPGQQPPPVRYY